MGVWYTTREDVKSALDFRESARANGSVDRAIESASRAVEGLLRRKFYPVTTTRYFDWPNYQRAATGRLWLGPDEVISVSSLTSAGVAISASDYFLEPANSGPPYGRIEIDLASAAAFGGGDTHQRSIAVTGVFGYTAETAPAGALAEALDASETAVDVTNSSLVGVGTIILSGSERMIVTEKSMLDSGQNIGGNLTAQQNDVSVSVSTGSSFHVGETILVDSERMLIVDISGNTLTVKRAYDGTTLATHNTGADIYVPRTLTVTRGALGSTAATHADAAALSAHVVPGLVRELCLAEAVNTLLQRAGGYARTVGSGESEREAGGRGLRDIRAAAMATYGRQARTAAV